MTVTAMTPPDRIFVVGETGGAPRELAPSGPGAWERDGVAVQARPRDGSLRVSLTASTPVSTVALRWAEGVAADARVLGDAWERSYGDLGFGAIRPERALPWYWMATGPSGVRGAGVRVRPGAMCHWTVEPEGVTLWLDVRAGARPVDLAGRSLVAADVVRLDDGRDGVGPWRALRELVVSLGDPAPSTAPLVGANNWNYAYGVGFDADAVVRDAATVSELSGDGPVRPFGVVDDGWTEGGGSAPGGPWTTGVGSFADMERLAERVRGVGARPGLWFRPLLSREPVDGAARLDSGWRLDPSLDETLERVRTDLRRFADWGFELVKHDFSTYDSLGRFCADSAQPLPATLAFADRSRTTAEILTGLYRAVRDGAGDTLVLGCNVVGHLAAGLVDAQRTGDDTSGRSWERTRRMGVNTLAFRLAQDGAFFRVDADCVASTPSTPWELNRRFLELVAASGTALFISVDPSTRTPAVDADLRRALQVALAGGVPGGIEPLDWTETSAPRRWRIGGEVRELSWSEPWGATAGVSG